MTTPQKQVHIPLPASLRKHVRERKAQLRRQFGTDSVQYKDFLAWIQKKRQEKAGEGASASLHTEIEKEKV